MNRQPRTMMNLLALALLRLPAEETPDENERSDDADDPIADFSLAAELLLGAAEDVV